MRKGLKVALLSISTLTVVGLSVGISLAAYNAPSESNTIQFGEMVSNNHNFQTLAYYFAGGSGTENDPFLVNNSQQLRNFAKLWNIGAMPAASYVSLGTSFQYEGSAMEPIGTSTYPFTGVFNGYYDSKYHSITGLNVSTSSYTDVGMFGRVGTTSATGTVQNLILIGPSVSYTGSSAVNIGLVVGYKNTTTKASIVQNIDIYGGTANFSNFRAHLYSGGTATCGNGIVGSGGSSTSGFVSAVSSTPTFSVATYTSGITASTHYYIYHNGSSVTATTS